VPLDGSSLEEIAGVYFRQSEQIPTRVRLAVAELIDRGPDGKPRHRWRAGGLIAQFLPDAPERMQQKDLPGGDGDDGHDIADDDAWAEARALVETIDMDELTDPHVGVERLLFRLFHERGVRIYPPQKVLDRCTCSRDKIKGILEGFSAEEIESSQEDDGCIAVSCEFCSTTYRYEPSEFRQSKVG
jgi:molecular chaperone Hsp33